MVSDISRSEVVSLLDAFLAAAQAVELRTVIKALEDLPWSLPTKLGRVAFHSRYPLQRCRLARIKGDKSIAPTRSPPGPNIPKPAAPLKPQDLCQQGPTHATASAPAISVDSNP